MKFLLRVIGLPFILLMISQPFTVAQAASETVSIRTKSGETHFQVEIATTPEEQARGLMFRDNLQADSGMLFLFREARSVTMWMKDTLIPLDMIFIKSGGAGGGVGYIVNIAENTTPNSLALIPSAEPVTAVLEVPAGTAARIGAQPGNRVSFSRF